MKRPQNKLKNYFKFPLSKIKHRLRLMRIKSSQNSRIMISSVLESICKVIFRQALKHQKFNKFNVRKIDMRVILDAFKDNNDLHQVLQDFNVRQMLQPEITWQMIQRKFDSELEIKRRVKNAAHKKFYDNMIRLKGNQRG